MKIASADGCGELPAGVGVAGLEDHRATLRAARHVEVARDVEVVVVDGECPRVRALRRNWPASLSAMISTPDHESNSTLAASRKLCGPLVPLLLRQEPATPEVLAGERVPGGDHVPGGAAAGQVVQGRELPGDVVRLVEGRVDRAGQARACR